MASTLSDLFQLSKGKPVDYGGRLVHGIFSISIKAGNQKCEFRRLRADLEKPSGMHFKCAGGMIEINDFETKQMTLWADTSPECTHFNIRAEKNCVLKMWNKWRFGNSQQAWLGNSGMIITAKNSDLKFECSQGFGDVDFSAFVAELTLKD